MRVTLLILSLVLVLVQSYFASLEASDTKQRDATRSHFVDLLRFLCTAVPDATAAVPPALWPLLLPILRDVLRHDNASRTTLPAAWQVATKLLQGPAEEVSAALCGPHGLLVVLSERLSDAKPQVVMFALRCLTDALDLVSDVDTAHLDAVLAPLAQMLCGNPTAEVLLQAGSFVEKFAARGTAAVTMLANHAQIFVVMCRQLTTTAGNTAELAAIQQAARAVLQSAERADSPSLATLLEAGLYGALFKILHALPAHIPANTDLVLRALECLHKLVMQVENIEGQVHCDEPRGQRWRRVSKLASAVGDAGAAGAVPGKVKVLASRLLVTARTTSLAAPM
jgi:hypothetical protein